MGFETFRVELHGGRAEYDEIDETVRKLPNVKLDQHSMPLQGSTFYAVTDGLHIIEIELKDSPVRLSCRFTLCHPASVDLAFSKLAQELMIRLGMVVKICDDVRPEDSHCFALPEFAEFWAVASGYIASRRSEWKKAFGEEPMAASTIEAHERIILPRCQPADVR